MDRNYLKCDCYPRVEKIIQNSYTWTAIEYSNYNDQVIKKDNFEHAIYRNLRNEIIAYIETNGFSMNWDFLWHCEIDCNIERKTCCMTVSYGPKERVEYWKVQTELEKRRLGL